MQALAALDFGVKADYVTCSVCGGPLQFLASGNFTSSEARAVLRCERHGEFLLHVQLSRVTKS